MSTCEVALDTMSHEVVEKRLDDAACLRTDLVKESLRMTGLNSMHLGEKVVTWTSTISANAGIA